MENNITLLFKKAAYNSESKIIQLLNRNHELIGAIYLNKLKANFEDIVVCEASSTQEKYYIFLNGIAVFFTYYKST